ncbi:hypothetical protein JX265_002418 [Neoarthrinium moseri]|uniref:Protein kinase domain-containing protein n=1 Tax=Neoarthrinium moseri TaxID=1658444 RepID=A0A9Q0ASZ8_9PEZI|nr:hypothetical protein JX265_002418 [Neoarthrinium moseri]
MADIQAPAVTATASPTVPPSDQPDDANLRPAGPGLASTRSLPSPQIAIHEDAAESNQQRPSMLSHISAPAAQQFHSPMRQHKRTPSQHREVKETLNARSEYTSDDADGTKLRINQYVIREEIGRGSYGAVHIATDQFGNEYAIKEFSKTRLRKRAQSNILRRPQGERPGRFPPGRGLRSPWAQHQRQLSNQDAAEAKDSLFLIREEIAIMKKLNHPNLVSLIEVLDDPEEDSLWMVLEMCKKGVVMNVGLEDHANPYPDEQCRYWFRDLILGIEYLHAQGIIHRDIKPDNLLLTEDDCLKIVDFGVSEMFEKPDQMMTAKSAGSPAFLPPELCMARHGDINGKSADIWSMGVSLYCLKYGKLPFHRNNVLEMYESIRTDELPILPEEDPNFVDLITRVLDKDPNTRISMHDLRNHPWVTKGGDDPLLSEESNCSQLVEPPNELEVNHAFTRKMDHIMTVMKAINKFKGLVFKSRSSTPRLTSPRTPKTLEIPDHVSETSRDTSPAVTTEPPAFDGRPRHKSIAEEAAELVEARKAYLASSDKLGRQTTADGENDAEESSDASSHFLGIGVGGRDDFGTPKVPTAVVSDSPTGIDFNIYDRAFEAEMSRIRSEKHSHRKTTYLTKFVNEKEKYFGDECMILEAGRSLPSLASSSVNKAGSAAAKTLEHVGFPHRDPVGGEENESSRMQQMREAVDAKRTQSYESIETIKEKGQKFAELVMGTMQSAKTKATGASKESE